MSPKKKQHRQTQQRHTPEPEETDNISDTLADEAAAEEYTDEAAAEQSEEEGEPEEESEEEPEVNANLSVERDCICETMAPHCPIHSVRERPAVGSDVIR